MALALTRWVGRAVGLDVHRDFCVVALEVTASCWEVARILEPFVDRVVVVSPDDTGISCARAKTDKLDARSLGAAVVARRARGGLDAG